MFKFPRFSHRINWDKFSFPSKKTPYFVNFSQCKSVYSKKNEIEESGVRFLTFMEKINLRRSEARRSLLVQVQSAKSYKELHSYCSLFGKVKHMFHYETGVEPQNFILVEFDKESEVQELVNASSYLEDNLIIPAHSHFLWFKASNKGIGKIKQSKAAVLSSQSSTDILKDSELGELLNKCENITHQIRTLHKLTKLNDVGIRLRFLTALQIENMISGIFPYAVAYPFGSSVNGYGKMGCDLDLALKLVDKKNSDNSRLIFHCKAATGSERTTNQRHIEAVGDIIYLFLPGCAQVRRILQARIPIVKYHQQLTDVECDLSMTNMSGVYMSDFLYLMGEIDNRVRPLIFSVKKWASSVGLTNSSPGRWITNFSLTLLVLAFLQRPLSGKPILPSLNTLIKLSGPDDKYITDDGINCTFLRDLSKYTTKTKNTDSLESLLREFFEYYSQFDFSTKAVCLNEAIALTKPEFSPMYIVNPLERGLNVSKNVSQDEVERFKSEAKNAAWQLESQENKTVNWGLFSIFENKKPQFTNVVLPTISRMVEVSTLFEEGMEENDKYIEYKNENVKKEVENIKKERSLNLGKNRR